jgi:hypothetical protein
MVFLLFGSVPLAVLLAKATCFLSDPTATGQPGNAAGSETSPAPTQRKRGKNGVSYSSRKDAPKARRLLWLLARPALCAAPILLLVTGLRLGHEELHESFFASNYFSCQRNWSGVLDVARRLPKGQMHPFVSHDITRALYHTGRLPYDMFKYPLIPEAIWLTNEKETSYLAWWKLSDFFLELGAVNMAQKMSSELLTKKSHCGRVIQELGWINIIKGCPDAARVYLNALKKDLLYRSEAESLLQGLDHGFTPDQAAYIQSIRSRMLDDTAGVVGDGPVSETLSALLSRNPRNKMAFEYLMAYYLVTRQVDKIAENVGRLHDLGYERVPTLYEEALLIHSATTGQRLDPSRFDASQDTLQRFETFRRIASALQTKDRQAALNRLIRDFGTSYLFYYRFGQVGQA